MCPFSTAAPAASNCFRRLCLPSPGKYKNLAENLFWWKVPAFLKLKRKEWPNIAGKNELQVENAMKETLKSDHNITHVLLAKHIFKSFALFYYKSEDIFTRHFPR